MSPLLEFDNVSMTFRARQRTVNVLRDVSLTVEAGEIVSLIGPSGCGKSTLLNIAAGLLAPTGGRAVFEGNEIRGTHPVRGMVFQQYALFPWMTVKENAEYGLRLQKVRRQRRAEIAARYIELMGLSDFATAYPKELSGGMRQRVALARAYAVDPRLLLMDEPFGALDAMTRWRLIDDLIQTWLQTKSTIVFVTHDIDEAIVLGHRVVVMSRNPGRIAAVIPVDAPHPREREFRNSPQFESIRRELWDLLYADHNVVREVENS